MILTVYETATFIKTASSICSEDERLEFIHWIAAIPDCGDVMLDPAACVKCGGGGRALANGAVSE